MMILNISFYITHYALYMIDTDIVLEGEDEILDLCQMIKWG